MPQTPLDQLATGTQGLVNTYIKQHYERDPNNRVSHVYEAVYGTAHGAPCVLTRYQYVALTTDILGIVEEPATWDSSWDF